MNIFLFTGLSASGKSTISKAFAQEMNLSRVDLHVIIHEIAKEHGFDRGRDWIGSVGIENSLAETRVRMLNIIRESRNEPGLVIDEVIDPETLAEIQRICPEDEIKIIYIKTNRHDREHLMAKRLGVADETTRPLVKKERDFIDRQKDAVGIRQIIGKADIKVWNNGRIADIVGEVVGRTRGKERC